MPVWVLLFRIAPYLYPVGNTAELFRELGNPSVVRYLADLGRTEDCSLCAAGHAIRVKGPSIFVTR